MDYICIGFVCAACNHTANLTIPAHVDREGGFVVIGNRKELARPSVNLSLWRGENVSSKRSSKVTLGKETPTQFPETCGKYPAHKKLLHDSIIVTRDVHEGQKGHVKSKCCNCLAKEHLENASSSSSSPRRWEPTPAKPDSRFRRHGACVVIYENVVLSFCFLISNFRISVRLPFFPRGVVKGREVKRSR